MEQNWRARRRPSGEGSERRVKVKTGYKAVAYILYTCCVIYATSPNTVANRIQQYLGNNRGFVPLSMLNPWLYICSFSLDLTSTYLLCSTLCT